MSGHVIWIGLDGCNAMEIPFVILASNNIVHCFFVSLWFLLCNRFHADCGLWSVGCGVVGSTWDIEPGDSHPSAPFEE